MKAAIEWLRFAIGGCLEKQASKENESDLKSLRQAIAVLEAAEKINKQLVLETAVIAFRRAAPPYSDRGEKEILALLESLPSGKENV